MSFVRNKFVLLFLFLFLAFSLAVGHIFFVFQADKERESLQANIQVIPLGKNYARDQLIVQFHEGYAPQLLQEDIKRREELSKSFFGNIKLSLENFVLWYKAEEVPEEKLIFIDAKLKEIGVVSYEATIREPVTETLGRIYLLNFKSTVNLEDARDRLAELYFIVSIEPNVIFFVNQDPNDPLYPQLWGFQKISMPQAWDISTGSESILVGVIDSGIDINHPEFAGRLVGGYDFLRNDSIPDDELGHGTHVSGTIGAIGNNALGVAGINWNVKIIPLKICDASGKCLLSSLGNAINTGLQDGAKVFNMSLGGETPCPPSLQSAINASTNKGSIVVAAAGNSNGNADNFAPGNCQNVLTVGAVDIADARSVWSVSNNKGSNYGSVVEIAAPGTGIISTMPGGNYASKDGTSMASPHVAGAAALLLSVNPGLSAQQVFDCIVQNSDPISTDFPIGGKRLNVSKMLTACKDLNGNGTPTSSPNPSPSASPIPSPTVISPSLIISPSVTIVPTITVTPPTQNQPVIIPIPSPGERFYTCSPDPSCNQNTNVIQLCPLVCKPI